MKKEIKEAKKALKNQVKENPVLHREDREQLIKMFVGSDVPKWGSLQFKVL